MTDRYANHTLSLIHIYGTCEFQQGFAFNDLLTNLERIAAHCSNVAVAMIETDSDEFDTHEYLKLSLIHI